MTGESATQARLCPCCANSIEESATTCPYCNADLLLRFIPQWMKRDESHSKLQSGADNKKKFSVPAKLFWMAAMLVTALIAFLVGGYRQQSQLASSSQAAAKELQAKDQMIQSQEAQLAQVRQQLNETSHQLAEIKTKLEERQRELSVTQKRLGVAGGEVERLKANRSVAPARNRSPALDAAQSLPVPVAARRAAEPGVYETTRETSVHEDPASASRVVSQIGRGTRINVVRSAGEWLEVRSKHGNPPGYVRADDARLIARTN